MRLISVWLPPTVTPAGSLPGPAGALTDIYSGHETRRSSSDRSRAARNCVRFRGGHELRGPIRRDGNTLARLKLIVGGMPLDSVAV